MPRRSQVYLHVGAMKTGTTYLQGLVFANRDRLAEAGLGVPGDIWPRQVRGVQDVLRLNRRDSHIRRDSRGAWQDLLDEMRTGTSPRWLISMEFLSFAERLGVRRVMDSLSWADVSVILTVRDMTAVLPSLWQTLVHNGATFSWPDYLDAIPSPGVPVVTPPHLPGRGRTSFHRHQNVARMLRRWRRHAPEGALHVVTVPADGGDQLWPRFASVLGVDPGLATEPPRASNPSLGYASTDLLRRVNQHLGRLPASEYNWTVKEPVAIRRLAPRADLEPRTPLTRPAYDLALGWNASVHAAVAETGAVVTGDLADLPATAAPERTALPAEATAPSEEAVLDAAVVAARGLTRVTRRRVRQLRRAGAPGAAAGWPPPRARRQRWLESQDPVDAASSDLADQAREAAAMLRRVREQRRRTED